ncbi:MAG: AzlC family ABC transporter permease [Desulfovibrionales bacterium]|nr:AzlC family ABC transporter permease [Desulfovibrionales bacterium]
MTRIHTAKQSFLAGARTIIPVMPGILPFGMLTGVVTVSAGVSPFKAVCMTLIMFAGAAQVSVAQLLSEHSTAVVIIATALMINLRFVMYSASITPYLGSMNFTTRLLLSYSLSDQAYATSIVEFNKEHSRYPHLPFFAGACASLWTIWTVSAITGIFFGALIPPSWSFDFAVPLTFLALLVPNITDTPSAAAAVVAAVVAILAVSLPYNMGLMTGAFAGILTGVLLERRIGVQHG